MVYMVMFVIRILPTEKENAGFEKAMKCVKILAKCAPFQQVCPPRLTSIFALT